MVGADCVGFSSLWHFSGYLIQNKIYKRILVWRLKTSSLKITPYPSRISTREAGLIAPAVDWRVVARAVRAVAAACWGPWRPMRFCCRPPSCPTIALIFISHQEEKMQKGKGAAQAWKWQAGLKNGREARKERWMEARSINQKQTMSFTVWFVMEA